MQQINGRWLPTVNQKQIIGFFEDYRWLSNFHPSPLVVCGIQYPTAEHAYQAYKTLSRKTRLRIASMCSPGQAKRAAQNVALRDDWDRLRLVAMYKTVGAKFAQNPELAERLLATQSRELIEANYWGDIFWGAVVRNGVCYGQNHLGKTLMRVRDELRT